MSNSLYIFVSQLFIVGVNIGWVIGDPLNANGHWVILVVSLLTIPIVGHFISTEKE